MNADRVRPETSNLEPRTPERRLLACWWSIVRSGQITEARAYQVASEAVGRTLQPGFGLSTLTKVELIRVVDALKRAIGQAPGRHCMGSRPAAQTSRAPKGGNVVRLGSLAQFQLVQALQEELRLSDEELHGIVRRATGKEQPKRADDLRKIIEALKAIRERRSRRACAQRGYALSSRAPQSGA
ncbi:MAG: hypothetical protein HY613_07200 [Candidatus Rokubacteria bacterium]|nr:hypothetical protein [Candidatus Rokubacteria bacterium]